MPGLQFNKIGVDQIRIMWLLVYSEAVESKLVKLENSQTVILPPMVLCPKETFTHLSLPKQNFRNFGFLLVPGTAPNITLFK